jgi:rubrerythrin
VRTFAALLNEFPKTEYMTKQMIILSAALISGWVVFSSCNNAGTKVKLQEPVASGMEKERNAGQKEAGIKTTEDLLAAFKGETTASAKYAAYSKKAEEEGYHQIALLFKAASAAEKIHANNHKAVLEESGAKVTPINPEYTVKSTKENLQDAIKGETYEATTMYPEFLKNAEAAGDQLAMLSLNYAYKTEKRHRAMYENALAALGNNTVKSLSAVYYVCATCGNTYDTTPPSRCGICMTSAEKFIKISGI